MSERATKTREAAVASTPQCTVACFGEVLWDCLPKGLFLGGAPINAAYHLAKQNLHVVPVTAVGRDFLGEEALRRIESWGLDVGSVARDPKRATGTVRAALDASGIATYQITRDVAWDHIAVSTRLQRLKPEPQAIVHGTLALRGPSNRAALQVLLNAWPNALRVVDLNFREPFDTAAVIAFALKHAQLVKLNDAELRKLTGTRGQSPAALERGAKRLAATYNIARICVTAGENGAGLWWEGEWFWEDARPVKVRDTVGAGDAFLSGLLGALLARDASPQKALAQACRLGEFVASQDGATPVYQLGGDARPVA